MKTHFGRLTAGDGYKKFMNKMYGIGAAIVIIGALCKLQHIPNTAILLYIGLGTEALIFFLSAFEPVPEENSSCDISKSKTDFFESDNLAVQHSFSQVEGNRAQIPTDIVQKHLNSIEKSMELTSKELVDYKSNLSSINNKLKKLDLLYSNMLSVSLRDDAI